MMNEGGAFGVMAEGWGIWGTILWFVILIDFVLVGVWLWKKINKK